MNEDIKQNNESIEYYISVSSEKHVDFYSLNPILLSYFKDVMYYGTETKWGVSSNIYSGTPLNGHTKKELTERVNNELKLNNIDATTLLELR